MTGNEADEWLKEVYASNRVDALLAGVRDAHPEGANIDGAITQAIVGELRTPKRLDTIRRNLLRYWPMIEKLPPDQFDEIMLEYAELVTTKWTP